MNTFKSGGGFTRGGGGRNFTDRPKFDGGKRGGSGGGRSFSDKPRRDNRDGGERQTFQATCASCQKSCDVPFKPTGDKPVYCSDCFSRNRPDERESSRPHRLGDKRTAPSGPRYDDAKVEQRLTLIEGKLQRILDLLQLPKDASEKSEIVEKPAIDTASLTKAVAKAIKKPAVKKAAAKKVVKKVSKKK